MVESANSIGALLNVALYSFVLTIGIAGILTFSEKYKNYKASKAVTNNGKEEFFIVSFLKDFKAFLQNKKCETCPIAMSHQGLIQENEELKLKVATNYELYATADALKNFAKGMAVDVNGNVVIDVKTIEDIRSVGIGLQSILGSVDMSKANTSSSTFYMIERLKEKFTRTI